MAEFAAGLYARLSGFAGLAALVGTRIYPNVVEQDVARPAVSFRQISGPRDATFDGPSGLVQARFQLDCWAKDYDSARAVGTQVRLALNGYRGSEGGVVMQASTLGDERDLYDAVRREHGVSQDYSMWIEEG